MAAAKWNTIKFETSDDDDDELIGYTTYVSFFSDRNQSHRIWNDGAFFVIIRFAYSVCDAIKN